MRTRTDPVTGGRQEEHRRKRQKITADPDDDGMEDFDEDEDDSDSDDSSRGGGRGGGGGGRKKQKRRKKKKKVNDFILDEAEVDDDVEEDEEWEEGAEDIIDTKGSQQERGRDLDSHRRLQKMFNDQKEDEIEQYYRKKYAEQQSERYYEGDGDLPDDIAQQALQPGVKDPNLWMVKCRIGEEKQTVHQLMRKFIAYQNKMGDEPLAIKSVVAPEGIKGYIYIEAYKQAHLKQAIEGIGALRMGTYKQHMIPIKEMTDVLRVTKDTAHIKPKQWVRLKRGIYKDDLAQVDFVDSAQGSVHLKLIPRIDYTRMRGALKETMGENQKRKLGKRPIAKPFDPEAIRGIGGEISTDGDFQIFEGNRYRRGFLYKNFNINALLVDGVKPSLTELERFEEQVDGVDVSETHVAEEKGHHFAVGDNVEVTEGELMHLQGKITAIDGQKITMLPKHEDLKEPLDFQAHEIRKYFTVGDHVRIIAGQYEKETGMVLRVEEKYLILFADLTMHEIKVLPKDCQISADMATGVDSMGQFQLGDLVQLDASNVGVIVRLEKENFQILKLDGKLAHVRHQAVSKRKDRRNVCGLDADQNQISVKDQVKVIDGPYTGRQGEIRHLYRGYAFIHSRLLLENGGIFVCRTRSLQLAGGSRVAPTIDPSAGYMSPRAMMSPRHGDGKDGAGGRGGGGGGGGRTPLGQNKGGRAKGDLELIGKTIKITKGQYKGHIGIVKDAIGQTARVELHSACQTITVDKSRIDVVCSESGARVGQTITAYDPSRTPMYGSQTPMPSGGRTPGSQTPMYQSGSRTPRADGSATPMYDPSRTPIHSSSAWDANAAATPRADFDDYGADPSPSPSYHNPPTPGYLNPDTPQGGPYTPQTPGMYAYSQPSPGLSAPSPSGSYPSPVGYGSSSVTTPSPAGYTFSPMTPGGGANVNSPMTFNPHTPGAGMESMMGVEWHTTDIEVRIRASHDDPDLANQTGTIRGISGSSCSVFLPSEDRVVNISSEHLEPVPPAAGDKIKVIYGDQYREATGTLLSVDGLEGVVQLDEGGGVKLINIQHLCRMGDSG